MGISGNIIGVRGGRRLASAALAVATAGGAAVMMAPQAHAATTSNLVCGHDATYPDRYDCTISGTTDQTTVTLPRTDSAGVRALTQGTTVMKSGAGTMTVTATSITFNFSPAYTATHAAPYQFSGGFSFSVDNKGVAGPFSITVDGKTYVTNGPGGYCGPGCTSETETGTHKLAWDGADGRAEFELIRGADVAVVGQRIDFVDHAGKGQSDCKGTIDQQQPDGSWKYMATATTDGTNLTGSFTPTVQAAVRLFGSCKADGSQSVYSDNGTIAGIAVTAQTTVTNIWADGKGVNKPAPTVTETYQVDVASLRSNAVVNKYAAADDDGVLNYRELAPLWQKAVYAKNFSEKHEYVTITVPANATAAQRMAAINAKTKLGDVTTTAKLATSSAKKLTEVVAWKLDTANGAKPVDGGAAWGAKHNLAQTFFARS